MRKLLWFICFCGCLFTSISALAQEKPSLKGSPAAVGRKSHQADLHDFTRLRTGGQVKKFFDAKLLVQLMGNDNYRIADGVSYPYVRPAVQTFIERLSAQSRQKSPSQPKPACPMGLVVTSSTRPIAEQPINASPRSVHPTGMAVDLRVPDTARCRAWLERTLLGLEGKKVLEVTREKNPPHYDIAVFPGPYMRYIDAKRSLPKAGTTKKKVPVKRAPTRRK